VREAPPELAGAEPELRGAGDLFTEGVLRPDGVDLTAGVLRVAGAVRRTEVVPEFPDRLSGRLYVALLVGLVYVEPLEEPLVELLPSGFTLLV
jgi:hypothetical protein